MKLVFFTENKDCLADITNCPENQITDSEACGCLDEQSVNNESVPVTSTSILGSDNIWSAFLCASNHTVTFSVSVVFDVEGSEPVYTKVH